MNKASHELIIPQNLEAETAVLGSMMLDEKAISAVTDSLAEQQRAIEQFHKDNTNYNGEISGLKNKLRELYKEYDIILSENYSLRAKVKSLEKELANL